MSARTHLLQDLRLVRSHLENAHDGLCDLNLYSLQLAEEARDKIAEALDALQQEIKQGEDAHNSSWPERIEWEYDGMGGRTRKRVR